MSEMKELCESEYFFMNTKLKSFCYNLKFIRNSALLTGEWREVMSCLLIMQFEKKKRVKRQFFQLKRPKLR